MKSFHLTVSPGEACAAHNLPLRIPQASGIIDPEPFRARARGEGEALTESFAESGGMRTLHCDPARPTRLFNVAGPLLTMVISGGLDVDTANRGPLRLDPGDLFLTRCGGELEQCFTPRGDCRLVQVLVDEDWPGPRARLVLATQNSERSTAPSNLKRMYREADDQSRFREFVSLFGPKGEWSRTTPLVGLRFLGMAEDTFIDWHPEVVNNLVIVLSGALELEVGGGGGAVEVFGEGDVCLAEDRTGQGHIDRMHGHVQVAILIVDDADLWP